ncbi:acyl-CoA dehydrogenase family protein [Mycolicibacterium pyrenivorans]|uniref:acyl-CoA dehydrogenase family protein n=1 Tax=Mycolicibacterium pyrenivorans TaxID=187102 RepID=UPI0021F2CF5C|nr:acyl-CoA dehydrogenase family protein [Mycolicibacterium pyrenivorans]MCV7151257.1 acyl-CoA/acyl-ACP dehydrogenase [Mycolicibacterium pyrenivorans]
MTDTLTSAELVEASRRVLETELPLPTGLETQPLIGRWNSVRPHLEALGWFDLITDPAQGGLGLPASHASRLIRLAGSYLTPGPLVEQVLTVPLLLNSPIVRTKALGDLRGSIVVTVDACHDLAGLGSGPAIELDGGRLRGSLRCVLGAPDAEVFLVHASSQTGPERLLVLPSSHPGVQVQQLRSVDPCQSVGDVAFDCQISDEQMLDSDNEALAANLRAWNRFGAAEYLAGITERVLTFAVDYAREREQFGRKIGSFQAVQHMLADIAVATRSLVNLMDLSSTEMSDVDDAERVMISVTAKARAGAQSVSACETVLQVLGGIGYTVEHSLNHFFKRALSLAAQQGSPADLHLLAGRLLLARSENC